MRKGLTELRFYPSVLTVFCFFAGIVLGTVWVNLMAKEIQAQLGSFGQASLAGGARLSMPQMGAVLPVLFKRWMAAGILWLIGMTAFAVPGFLAVAAFGGFSMSSVISLMTVQNGLLGLPVYLLSVFPQALFYVPVICVLFLWGLKPDKSAHPAGFAVLLLTAFLGSLAETCLNPYCMHFLSLIK